MSLSRNVRRLGHIDLPGAGQVCVAGTHAYVGHIPNKDHLGTSIVDISDPANPRVVATITLDDQTSHSHKARVVGDIMIVNHERNPTAIGRRADELPRVMKELTAAKGRAPTHAEIATWLGVEPADVAEIEAEAKRGYHNGGFKVYDVSNPAKPKEIVHQKTGGIGVHRFDMDERYAYISTEMDGYVGNILVIYDMRDPAKPQEVSRWWMPGQHIAGGETPTWLGRQHRLHHALRFGDEMWASCWHAGFRIVDVSDLSKPTTKGGYNYHPLFPEPTHTAMPVPKPINGKRIALAIDEEDQAQSANEEQTRRGRAHACILTFDVTDPADIKPLGQFQVSELELAVRAHAGRPLRRASVLRAHVGHDLLRDLVRRRPAHHRRRQSALAARDRPLHPGAGGRAGGAADQRRGARRQGAGLYRRPLCRLRRAGIQGLTVLAPSARGAFPLN